MGGGFISCGFRGRRRQPEEASGRVPPGQYLVEGFPVLSTGTTLVEAAATALVGPARYWLDLGGVRYLEIGETAPKEVP